MRRHRGQKVVSGAIATQSFANTTYGPKGLRLLREGVTPKEVLEEALPRTHNESGVRLVSSMRGDCAATFTGKACLDWAGGRHGKQYVVQGNILTGQEVVDAMAEAFETAKGELGTRLIDALEAGQKAGGDRRGRQAAALYIAREGWGYMGLNDRYRDIRVDDHKEPIRELRRIYQLHRRPFPNLQAKRTIRSDGESCCGFRATRWRFKSRALIVMRPKHRTLPSRKAPDWPAGGFRNLVVAAAFWDAMVADAARGEQFLALPQFLPDGRRFLFAALGELSGVGLAGQGVHAGSLDRPDERRLLVSGTVHLEQADGHVVFNREDMLLAQPFDSERVELDGEPVAIASSVAFGRSDSTGRFGVSPAGILAYFSGKEEDRFQLAWLDRAGQQVGTIGAAGAYREIALSPDGRQVAVTIRDVESQYDLWVVDVSRGVANRLTSDPANERGPLWSPDGRELVFSKEASDGWNLFRKRLQGRGPATPLLESPGWDFPEDWSRDGGTLLYMRVDNIPTTESSLWALSLAGGGPPQPVAQQPGFRFHEPRVSPDGRWLAYISNESGEWEVYVEPFQRPGERVRVSVNGGGQPKWRGDGTELFYRKLDGPLMAVDVREAAGSLELGLPTELFDAGEFGTAHSDVYAVSANGQRFLVMLPVEDEGKLRMHVVVNWESLLE